LIAAPIPKVAAPPIVFTSIRPMNAPIKRAMIAVKRWSRDGTLLEANFS
jgi:hypothetical protein